MSGELGQQFSHSKRSEAEFKFTLLISYIHILQNQDFSDSDIEKFKNLDPTKAQYWKTPLIEREKVYLRKVHQDLCESESIEVIMEKLGKRISKIQEGLNSTSGELSQEFPTNYLLEKRSKRTHKTRREKEDGIREEACRKRNAYRALKKLERLKADALALSKADKLNDLLTGLESELKCLIAYEKILKNKNITGFYGLSSIEILNEVAAITPRTSRRDSLPAVGGAGDPGALPVDLRIQGDEALSEQEKEKIKVIHSNIFNVVSSTGAGANQTLQKLITAVTDAINAFESNRETSASIRISEKIKSLNGSMVQLGT